MGRAGDFWCWRCPVSPQREIPGHGHTLIVTRNRSPKTSQTPGQASQEVHTPAKRGPCVPGGVACVLAIMSVNNGPIRNVGKRSPMCIIANIWAGRPIFSHTSANRGSWAPNLAYHEHPKRDHWSCGVNSIICKMDDLKTK